MIITQDPRRLHQTVLPVYKCPSDVAPDLNDASRFSASSRWTQPDHLPATSNYHGIFGHGRVRMLRQEGSNLPNINTGIFSHDITTKLRDVTDGASNTAIMGERAYLITNRTRNATGTGNGNNFGAGVWIGCADGGWRSDCGDDVWVSLRAGINQGRNRNERHETISSSHEGGAFVVMADGAVRFLNENIDLRTVRGTTPATDDVNGPVDSVMEAIMAKADGFVFGDF